MLKKGLLIIYQKVIQLFLLLLIPEVTGVKSISLCCLSLYIYISAFYIFRNPTLVRLWLVYLQLPFAFFLDPIFLFWKPRRVHPSRQPASAKLDYSLVELCFRRFKLSFLSRATVDFLLFARHLLI